MIRHDVPAGVRAEELSRYLRRAWPLLPGHALRDILKRKDVRVNGARSGKGAQVRGGDVLEIYGDARWFEPTAEILFDDGCLLAAIKPQGLPSLPDRDGVGADTMEVRLMRAHPSARLCHRLDAATGGVMLAAADDDTYERALAAFKTRELHKTYRAILCGEPPRGERTLRSYLFKDAKRGVVRVSDQPSRGSQEIVTRIKPLRELERGLWEAELEPITGRTHQLRAHMAHMGCPILGDDKYGDRELNRREGFSERLCLWCERIEIPAGGALAEYAGREFYAEAPRWLER